MKVILIEDSATEYLKHVVIKHVGQGIPVSELGVAYDLWTSICKAQTVDFSKLGEAEIEKLDANGVALNLESKEPEDKK